MNLITRIGKLAPVVVAFCAQGTPLWAADSAREDNSGLFVWIFLAFCALIIVAQLIPAVMMMLGFVKGVKKGPAQHTPKPVDQG